MILVFLLAAAAAVYYIVPWSEQAGGPSTPRPGEAATARDADGAAHSLATPGLLALGRALDGYGRGEFPRPPRAAKREPVHKRERDKL